jgi:hypothetical protein
MRFIQNGHAEVIKKVANLQPVNMNEFRQASEKLIPKSIVMLRHDGPNKYSILSNSDQTYHVSNLPMDREGVRGYLTKICDNVEDTINEVDQNGEKLLMEPKPEDAVFLARSDKEIIESAEEFGHYTVKTKTGVCVEGVVLPHVIDFDQKRMGLKIFLGKTMSSMQPEIFGVRLDASRFSLDAQPPRVGQTGTFVFQPDGSHGLATMPVTVKSTLLDGTVGSLKLVVADLMGREYNLTCSPCAQLKRITKTGEGSYMLPGNMKWIPMDGFQPITDSAESYAVKTAGARLTDKPVHLISTGHGFYAMKGVGKYASAAGWDVSLLQPHQVKFLLTSLGAGQDKIAQAFEATRRAGSAELHNLRFTPLSSEKIAQAMPLARSMAKVAEHFKTDLVKAASYMESTNTVDALLSLNFVSPENLTKFVSKLPHFKSCISQLASCLLASRLGVQELPESEISTAMQKLIEVVNGLETLKAKQEVIK